MAKKSYSIAKMDFPIEVSAVAGSLVKNKVSELRAAGIPATNKSVVSTLVIERLGVNESGGEGV